MATNKNIASKNIARQVAQVFAGMITIPPLPEQRSKAEYQPFVQLVGPGWKVSKARERNEGYADFKNKVVHVPVDESVQSERTRFHELAHVKWTPHDVDIAETLAEADVPMAFLNAFEDCRVNQKLINADPSFEQLLLEGRLDMDVASTIEQIRYYRCAPDFPHKEVDAFAAAMYVCSRQYGEAAEMRVVAEEVGLPLDEIDEIIATVTKPGAVFADTVEAAQALRDLLAEDDPPFEKEEGPGEDNSEPGEKSGGEGGGEKQEPKPADPDEEKEQEEDEEEGDDDGDGTSDEPLDKDLVDEMAAMVPGHPSPAESKPNMYDIIKAPEASEKTGGKGRSPEGGEEGTGEGLKDLDPGIEGVRGPADKGAKPGVMQILRPPLDERVVTAMHRPYVKKQDIEGGEIRAIHRLHLDSKVMRRKAPLRTRKRVGTLLIDVSGSMSVKVEQIERVLRSAPQVTVAVYGYNALDYKYRDTERERHGHLSIIAHRGKRVSEEEILKHLGGGNCVDLEAVRWLAAQPGPRFWVCDGIVTGRGDQQSAETTVGVKQIMRRSKIKRVPSMKEFVAAMVST